MKTTKLMRRGFAPIIIIALIAAFLIGIAATVGYFKLKPQPTTTPQSTSTPADLSSDLSAKYLSSVETQVLEDETANWKTYTNIQYSYSLNYPNEWIVKEENSPVDTVTTKTQIESKDYVIGQPIVGGGFIPGAKTGSRLEIYVSKNPNFKSYEEFKNFEETKSTEFPLSYFSSQEETTISGLKAIKKIGGKPYMGEQSYAYTFNKGTIYKIYLTSSTDQQAKFDQILSTFQFIN